jgi:NodT family efflux transporter outer membrane factor (OMF) lipoprotein
MSLSNANLSKIMVGVAASFITSACAVTTPYEAPSAPTQTTYVLPHKSESGTVADPAVALTSSPGSEQLSQEWWKVFRSPKIDELVDRAMANNNDLASTKSHLTAANSRIKAALGELMPQVDGGASVQRTRFGAPVLGTEAKGFPTFSAYSIGPAVSYNPDVFGRIHGQIELRQANADNAAAQLDAAKLTIAGNVVLQVLHIASLQEQVKVLQAIIETDQHNLSLVHAARKAGGISDIDVESSQSQLDHDNTLLPPLQRQLNETQDALAILTGLPPVESQQLDISLDAIMLPSQLPLVVPSALVHRRPDIIAAESNLHAASAEVGIATANLYPQVNLSATFGSQGVLSHGPTEAAWNLLGGITAPIFHGGSLHAERDAARYEYEASMADYHQTVLIAFGQVADSIQALTTDEAYLSAQHQALQSASRSLDLTAQGYRAGNAGYIQVLDATRLKQQAQLGEVQARTQSYVDSVELILATGGGLASAK